MTTVQPLRYSTSWPSTMAVHDWVTSATRSNATCPSGETRLAQRTLSTIGGEA